MAQNWDSGFFLVLGSGTQIWGKTSLMAPTFPQLENEGLVLGCLCAFLALKCSDF